MIARRMTIPQDVIAEIRELAAKGHGSDALIARMREVGQPKIVCIAILRSALDISLGEAKELVHFSPVWADRKASDDAFHESLYKTAERLGWLEPEEPLLRSGTHG